MMDLKEESVFPFTSPTTCYSVSSLSSIHERRRDLRFCTETHVVGVASGIQSSSFRPVVYEEVPRDNSSVICMGYAQLFCHKHHLQFHQLLPVQEVNSSEQLLSGRHQQQSRHHLQAFVLLDPVWVEPPHSNEISSAFVHRPNVTQAGTSSQQHVTARTNGRSTSAHNAPTSLQYENHHQTTSASPSSPIARLILRIRKKPSNYHIEESIGGIKNHHDTSELKESVDHNVSYDDFSIFVDFRPLAPCLAAWDRTVGMFVGSADDSKLRFYQLAANNIETMTTMPTSTNLSQLSLVENTLDLPEEHFQLDTPIMGMDFHSDEITNSYLLAMVGQDGTIQLITWKNNDDDDNFNASNHRPAPIFQSISSHRVIVDGPLVSIHIQEISVQDTSKPNILRVIVGSLCGYVCYLEREGGSTSWKGPIMIVQGLWNEAIQDEDSVMGVSAFQDSIILGTLSGRCMIYEMTSNASFRLMWDCCLPYSIHGFEVCCPMNDDSEAEGRLSSQVFDLVILTRRTVHIFRPRLLLRPTSKAAINSTAEAVRRAKDRLQLLLARATQQDEVETNNNKEVFSTNEDTFIDETLEPMQGDKSTSSLTETRVPDLKTASDIARMQSPMKTMTTETSEKSEDTDISHKI